MADRTTLDFYRRDSAVEHDEKYLFHTPEGTSSWSNQQYLERVCALADGLEKLGVSKGDRVMLMSDNRPEWHQVDLAVTDVGGVLVPVYGTLTPEQVAYQINDSGASVAITDTAEQMAKFLELKGSAPALKHLIQIDGTPAAGVQSIADVASGGGDAESEKRFWDRAEKAEPGDLLTIIYTSGTTGDPKGVMLTHENIVQNVVASRPRLELDPQDHALEFLPLCHSLERMVSYIYMYYGLKRSFCSVYHVGDLMVDIQPTIFAGVPRFFEKVYDKVMEMIGSAPALRQAIFRWAMDVGKKASHERLKGKQPSGVAYGIADKLVFSKIRDRMGGKVTRVVSGGAALPLFVNEFFHTIGVQIFEGYGLTETSPVISVNGSKPGMCRLGTVGKPLENLEVKIAADGELLVRGPNVMQGYWNKPDKTAEAFTDDWFHTGDIAEIDDDGFILITDRKKDIIVTGGGKNVAPQPIENELKKSRWVDTAAVVGDGRKFISCLISPNLEELEPWAKQQGLDYSDSADLVSKPEVRALFEQAISELNAKLARYEQVKEFRILPRPLSMEEGHLTPTMKVKRRVVESDFDSLIVDMYGE